MPDNKAIISDKDLYTIAIIRYKKEHQDLKDSNMFSKEWIRSSNYKLKIAILAEAIKNHVLVENTELYKKEF